MELEKRGNKIQRIISDVFILHPPKLEEKDYQNIITNFNNKLIFIEKNNKSKSADNYIPCLFYRKTTSSNFLIYFHGNSEHIFQIEYYGLDFRSFLEMNVIMVEYPGYSLYMDNNPGPNTFLSDSLIVYDWIKKTFMVSDTQIFVCGRSLGTSPAIYLSSQRNPKALFLISAFTSIKEVGADKNLSIFFEKIFNSINYIKDVKCPILFIHGKQDNTISYKHTMKLEDEVLKQNTETIVDSVIIDNMTHNEFNLKQDIIIPINNFLKQYNLFSQDNIANNFEVGNINELFKIPLAISIKIESIIFNITKFEIDEKIKKKDASLLMILNDGRIALVNGSKISIYNKRIELLDFEIDLKNKNFNEVTIGSLYQIKNGNLICATKEGNIYIFIIERRGYKLIKTITFEEIYKIGDFFENMICVLSKNYIKIYDESFSKDLLSMDNNKTFINFCKFSNTEFALIKNGIICLNEYKQNKINKIKEIKYDCIGYSNTLIQTNKYLIIGDIGRIYFLDITKNFEQESMIISEDYEEIVFIFKIHDELFLTSTNKGVIIQIAIKQNGKKEILKNYITNTKISSILFINYKTILYTEKDNMVILSTKKKSCEFI